MTSSGGDAQAPSKGYYTRMLGAALEQVFADEFNGAYRVYYDHRLGVSDSIIALMSTKGMEDKMAKLDIAVVSLRDGGERLRLLFEIEEHKDQPKRLLGDAAAITLSERVNINGRDHALTAVTIVLGFITRRNGQTGPRAERFISKFETAIGGAKRGIGYSVIFADDGPSLVESIKRYVRATLLRPPQT